MKLCQKYTGYGETKITFDKKSFILLVLQNTSFQSFFPVLIYDFYFQFCHPQTKSRDKKKKFNVLWPAVSLIQNFLFFYLTFCVRDILSAVFSFDVLLSPDKLHLFSMSDEKSGWFFCRKNTQCDNIKGPTVSITQLFLLYVQRND